MSNEPKSVQTPRPWYLGGGFVKKLNTRGRGYYTGLIDPPPAPPRS